MSMARIGLILWVLLATLAPMRIASAENSLAPSVEALQKRAKSAMERGEPAAAIAAINDALQRQPNDADLLYESAAALAMAGRENAASERLIEAITHGFVDLFRMRRDPRLALIRDHEQYQLIIRGWRELLDARGERNLESAKEAFGPGYAYERDEERRLIYTSAFEPRTFNEARQEIEAIAEWSYGRLFDRPKPNDPTPHPWVTVILPTPEDFVQFMRKLGAGPNIGGLYDNGRRQLIAQDIGPSLRHEFFHALHWRAMNERNITLIGFWKASAHWSRTFV